ncbi:MAG: AzlC family ABC transporter permease [Ruminococcus sp.]|nr:AzlC family ABC transporter permease [Ruminococcus sp.]
MKNDLTKGMVHGIPIALGYLSVSFGFGILAVRAGLSVFWSGLISLTNITSAGQAAGVDVISADGTLLEMILVQITINIRYSLMGISLSQRLDDSFTRGHRLLASYGITDEIFALCATYKGRLTPAYMYGIISVAALGWTSGTVIGAAAGEILPLSVTNAMGIMLYGMFLAIIIPPAKKQLSVLITIITAAVISIIFRYALTFVSNGFAVIISAVIAASAAAVLFPVKDDTSEGESK